MSIRSVDLQTLYPKLADAGRAQQARDESLQAAQQQFASQLSVKSEREAGQVKQTPETRGAKVGERSGRNTDQPEQEGQREAEQETAEKQTTPRPVALPGEPGQRLDLKG